MRLVNYGVGEISDRLSILALKLLHGTEAEKDVKHWRDEQNILLPKITTRALGGSWFESYTELAAVNATIWQGEDQLRAYRAMELAAMINIRAIIDVAFRLQELNDRRAELIEAINKETGDHIGPEKL